MADGMEPLAGEAGARVFECMVREAAELLAEAQEASLLLREEPAAAGALSGALAHLAAVGLWLASQQGAGRPIRLAPVIAPPLPPESEARFAEARRLSARAARLHQRALRLDALLSGDDESLGAIRTESFPEPFRALDRSVCAPSAPQREAECAPAASPAARHARARQIWLGRAVSSLAWM